MTDWPYYATFATNILAASLLALFFARRAREHKLSERKAKNLFTACVVVVGFGCGTVVFWGYLALVALGGNSLNLGHGEMLVAAPMFNILIATVATFVGRAAIEWRQIQW